MMKRDRDVSIFKFPKRNFHVIISTLFALT